MATCCLRCSAPENAGDGATDAQQCQHLSNCGGNGFLPRGARLLLGVLPLPELFHVPLSTRRLRRPVRPAGPRGLPRRPDGPVAGEPRPMAHRRPPCRAASRIRVRRRVPRVGGSGARPVPPGRPPAFRTGMGFRRARRQRLPRLAARLGALSLGGVRHPPPPRSDRVLSAQPHRVQKLLVGPDGRCGRSRRHRPHPRRVGAGTAACRHFETHGIERGRRLRRPPIPLRPADRVVHRVSARRKRRARHGRRGAAPFPRPVHALAARHRCPGCRLPGLCNLRAQASARRRERREALHDAPVRARLLGGLFGDVSLGYRFPRPRQRKHGG